MYTGTMEIWEFSIQMYETPADFLITTDWTCRSSVRLKFGKYGKAEITASATNVYDRPNIFYFDRVRALRVNQLPILPSLSMTS